MIYYYISYKEVSVILYALPQFSLRDFYPILGIRTRVGLNHTCSGYNVRGLRYVRTNACGPGFNPRCHCFQGLSLIGSFSLKGFQPIQEISTIILLSHSITCVRGVESFRTTAVVMGSITGVGIF